jgi:hypothetical protein
MSDVCSAICATAKQIGFVDPLTKLPPRDEITLSALLVLYHQADRIQWNRVPLLLTSGADSGTAASILFDNPGGLCSEYPLFWASPEELEARGGMRPDLVYVSHAGDLFALIENKVGGGLTHKGDSFGGQFGRYLKYLVDTRVTSAYFILLTSEAMLAKPTPWYVRELEAARSLQCPAGEVQTFVMTWQAVLSGVRDV